MIRILFATLALAWVLFMQTASAVAGVGSYLWKGDEVYSGGVCPDPGVFIRLVEAYARSIGEGNYMWGRAVGSGECFLLNSPMEFVLGDLVGSWRIADGSVTEIWTLLAPDDSVYPPLYGAFIQGGGGGHDTPYVAPGPSELPEALELAPEGVTPHGATAATYREI